MKCNSCYRVLQASALSRRGFTAKCNITLKCVTAGVTAGVTVSVTLSSVMLQHNPIAFTGAACWVSQSVTGVAVGRAGR